MTSVFIQGWYENIFHTSKIEDTDHSVKLHYLYTDLCDKFLLEFSFRQ